jgi:hypothetical protein
VQAGNAVKEGLQDYSSVIFQAQSRLAIHSLNHEETLKGFCPSLSACIEDRAGENCAANGFEDAECALFGLLEQETHGKFRGVGSCVFGMLDICAAHPRDHPRASGGATVIPQ